jgi:hypothetical protein
VVARQGIERFSPPINPTSRAIDEHFLLAIPEIFAGQLGKHIRVMFPKHESETGRDPLSLPKTQSRVTSLSGL